MIIFWCEFPREADWLKIKREVNFKTEIYVTCKDRKEFNRWQKKIKTKYMGVGAWPVLSKEDGYWFSGFTKKECIDRLDEFKGLKVKVDIEPPIWKGKYTLGRTIHYILYHIIKKGKNNQYLKNKIESLNFQPIISGFLLPKFLRKRFGDDIKGKKNYMCYTSFSPRYLRWLVRLIYYIIIKNMSKENFYAIGLVRTGIFGNEPVYEDEKELIKDLELMKRLKVKNLVIFNIEGLADRDWIRIVKKYVKGFS